jgi:hypothetical protein
VLPVIGATIKQSRYNTDSRKPKIIIIIILLSPPPSPPPPSSSSSSSQELQHISTCLSYLSVYVLNID